MKPDPPDLGSSDDRPEYHGSAYWRLGWIAAIIAAIVLVVVWSR